MEEVAEVGEIELDSVSIGTQTDIITLLEGEEKIPQVLFSGNYREFVERESSDEGETLKLNTLQQMVKSEGLSYVLDDDSIDLVKRINDMMIRNYHSKIEDFSRKEPFHLSDVFSPLQNSMKMIVEDEFLSCFLPTPYEAWITNIFYLILYLFGIVIRWFILLPLRAVFLILATVFTLVVISLGLLINRYVNGRLLPILRYFLSFYSQVWVLALGGVVFVRSKRPPRRPNQVFVANHTTVLDIAFLLRSDLYSMIGQNNTGTAMQILQFILKPMDNIFFEREDKHDRELVRMKLESHMKDVSKPGLLIFPEGTCGNNRFCLQFKKGAFELEDVEVCPIAIKYNLDWNDMCWYDDIFIIHVLRIMKGWATPCEIHFLDPQKKKPDENGIEFANRVKSMICRKIGLKNVNWNGYLRYLTNASVNQKMVNANQKVYASRIQRKSNLMMKKEEEEEEEETTV